MDVDAAWNDAIDNGNADSARAVIEWTLRNGYLPNGMNKSHLPSRKYVIRRMQSVIVASEIISTDNDN